MHAVGRGEGRRRRCRRLADRRPRHVRRRFSAQGRSARRKHAPELFRRATSAGRHCRWFAAELAADAGALCIPNVPAGDPAHLRRAAALDAGCAVDQRARHRGARCNRAGRTAGVALCARRRHPRRYSRRRHSAAGTPAAAAHAAGLQRADLCAAAAATASAAGARADARAAGDRRHPARRRDSGGDLVLSDRLAGWSKACSRRRFAGSVRRSSKSNRSPPIRAGK